MSVQGGRGTNSAQPCTGDGRLTVKEWARSWWLRKDDGMPVTTVTVVAVWVAMTFCFGLVCVIGKVHRADAGMKVNLALWYGLGMLIVLLAWAAAHQGKGTLSGVILSLGMTLEFLFVVIGRAYRADLLSNLLFMLVLFVVFGIPLFRSWGTGDLGQIVSDTKYLLMAATAIYVIVAVATYAHSIVAARRRRHK